MKKLFLLLFISTTIIADVTSSDYLGDWKIIDIKDEFGDPTGKKELNINVEGKYDSRFLNDATFYVSFFWNGEEDSWPRFYLNSGVANIKLRYYENRGRIKDIGNALECKYKDSSGEVRKTNLYDDDYPHQTGGKDDGNFYLRKSVNGFWAPENKSPKMIKQLIRKGDEIKFICKNSRDYSFKINFKYFENALLKLGKKA
ncbi:hypothetical protein N8965_00270 [Gammaproteobacteria bacterium]|nr:hypothetical protein [Gammaproteobacteria bacterium]